MQHEAPEVVSFEHFPAESSPDVTNEESTTSTPVTEDRNHSIAVAAATAAAAEAAVVAAQAAARVVRLAGYGRHSKEERAATLIQSHYRGYLVRLLNLICLIQTPSILPFFFVCSHPPKSITTSSILMIRVVEYFLWIKITS